MRRPAAWLAALLLPASCTPPLVEAVPGLSDGRLVFDLREDAILFGKGVSACLDAFSVVPDETDGEPLWRIEPAGEDCRMVHRIVYGVVPAGYRESVPPAALDPDTPYRVRGMTGRHAVDGGPLHNYTTFFVSGSAFVPSRLGG